MLEFDNTSLITFSGLVQCLFATIYLSSYQWKRNKWLVLFFMLVFLVQMGVFTGVERLSLYQKIFIGNPGLLLAILPSLYLFTKELVSIRLQQNSVLFHFVPALIFYILSLFFDETQPRVLITAFTKGTFPPLALLFMLVLLFINNLYGWFILQLIQKNQKKYKNEYAESTIYLTLDWLKYLIFILVGLSSITLLAVIFSKHFGQIYIPHFLVELMILLNILATSYFAFRQPTLYKRTSNNEAVEVELDVKIKTPKPLMNEEKVVQISKDLDHYLSEKRPFLNPKIRMPEIAAAMEITPNEFSWYLNEYKKTNFFTFINELRVNYAVQLLESQEYEHYTLEALSKLSGFRSKTTFNNRFKEIKNVTPSAFKKSIRS